MWNSMRASWKEGALILFFLIADLFINIITVVYCSIIERWQHNLDLWKCFLQLSGTKMFIPYKIEGIVELQFLLTIPHTVVQYFNAMCGAFWGGKQFCLDIGLLSYCTYLQYDTQCILLYCTVDFKCLQQEKLSEHQSIHINFIASILPVN